jgi:hypothetical protein
VERAISAYFYLRSVKSIEDPLPPWERAAKEMTIDQYFRETNFESNRMAGYIGSRDIRDFDFVGIMERYDDCISLFLRKFGGSLKVQIPHENDYRRAREDISPEIRRLIERDNEADLEIYKKALELNHYWLRRII